MRATAIVPVKRFGAAKQRLVGVLGPAERAELAAAMCADVLCALALCRSIERTLVVSGEPRVGPIVAAAGAGVELLDDPGDGGHSEAAAIGVAVANARGAPCVALLPGDCPLLDPGELDAATEAIGQAPAAGYVGVIPDRHGSGTNGLLLAPPGAIQPSFGPGSRERHLGLAEAAAAHGVVVGIDSLALDLDTEDDLRELRAELDGNGRAPATSAALERIDAGAAATTGPRRPRRA